MYRGEEAQRLVILSKVLKKKENIWRIGKHLTTENTEAELGLEKWSDGVLGDSAWRREQSVVSYLATCNS